jgi:hypothetical protein
VTQNWKGEDGETEYKGSFGSDSGQRTIRGCQIGSMSPTTGVPKRNNCGHTRKHTGTGLIEKQRRETCSQSMWKKKGKIQVEQLAEILRLGGQKRKKSDRLA